MVPTPPSESKETWLPADAHVAVTVRSRTTVTVSPGYLVSEIPSPSRSKDHPAKTLPSNEYTHHGKV